MARHPAIVHWTEIEDTEGSFPAGEGLAHTLINKTDVEVHLLVVGEASKPENNIIYPLNREMQPLRNDWWQDAPKHELGPHDSMPDGLPRAGKQQSPKS